MTDEIKRAEQRGYSKGYASGRKRLKLEDQRAAERAKENEFYNQALVALLPTCMRVQGWRFGEVEVKNVADRVKLANYFAEEAVKYRRRI